MMRSMFPSFRTSGTPDKNGRYRKQHSKRNTVGFKSGRVTFQRCLQTLKGAGALIQQQAWRVQTYAGGTGIDVGTIDTITHGSLQRTDNPTVVH